jgi:predicted solute-binding protein
MYVNDLTEDMGQKGKKALEKMFEMAQEQKMVEANIRVEVV